MIRTRMTSCLILTVVAAFLITNHCTIGKVTAQDESKQETENQAQQQSDNQDQGEETQEASREFRNFAEVVQKAGATLQSAKNYSVKVDCDFSATAEPPIKEEVQLQMTADQKHLRLDVRDKSSEKPQFVVCFHDSKLLRYSSNADKYSIDETDDPKTQLQTCQLTHSLLEMGSVSFLLMPNAGDTVVSDVANVTQFHEDDSRQHFELTMIDGRHIEVWFSAGDKPLPVEVRSTVTTTISEDQKMETVRHSKLVWSLDTDLPGDTFNFQPPESAMQVEDLAATIEGRGVEELIGKALPKLGLVDLKQKPVSLQKQETPMLLYFWGTWAAPSVEQIPGILDFAEKIKAKGVRVIAVDVADTPERLAEFIKINNISGEIMLDREGTAAHEMRLSHLPAVVLVDSENQVQAIYQNANTETRPKIVAKLEQLQSK